MAKALFSILPLLRRPEFEMNVHVEVNLKMKKKEQEHRGLLNRLLGVGGKKPLDSGQKKEIANAVARGAKSGGKKLRPRSKGDHAKQRRTCDKKRHQSKTHRGKSHGKHGAVKVRSKSTRHSHKHKTHGGSTYEKTLSYRRVKH